ncbi:MAG: SPOR domain-containing protein [Prevotella sp.]|nr:SPOR domain-containing protein [Prevotella sp.]
MKRHIIFAFAALGLLLTGCRSSESASAYKKAYMKAKAQEEAKQQTEPVVAPVATTPVVTTPTQPTSSAADASVKREKVTVVDGSPLKAYSVVVGVFGVKANAEGRQQTLKNKGYNAIIVRNEATNQYRVVASSFNDKAEAVSSRDKLRADYPDAWLLMNE